VTPLIISSRILILILFFHARDMRARLGLDAVMALLGHLLAGPADDIS
jgi:hypothetical protein